MLLLYQEARIPRVNLFVEKMIILAQKGNAVALHSLTDHVTFRVEWLIEWRQDLASWKFASVELRQKIHDCIIKCQNPRTFFSYLFVTLQKGSPKFFKVQSVKINKKIS